MNKKNGDIQSLHDILDEMGLLNKNNNQKIQKRRLRRDRKIGWMQGRPKRDVVINSDDITNLKILLGQYSHNVILLIKEMEEAA